MKLALLASVAVEVELVPVSPSPESILVRDDPGFPEVASSWVVLLQDRLDVATILAVPAAFPVEALLVTNEVDSCPAPLYSPLVELLVLR